MPLVKSPSRVLVTGANGFISTWILHYLLEAGYHVVAQVRTAEKGQSLLKAFGTAKFEFIVVEDVSKDGAFDDVAKSVQGIIHTASPVSFDIEDPQEMIDQAVDGTVGILDSALRFGSSIQRIVILSSGAAVESLHPEPRRFTEEDWGQQAIDIVKAEGKNSPGVAKYRASKTMAERSAWQFMEKNKDTLNGRWDLVVLNPSWVFGPQVPSFNVVSAQSLTLSPLLLYNALIHGTFGIYKDSLETAASWIDVRDLAKIHVLALGKVDELSGQRLMICVGNYCFQDFMDIMHSLSPPPFTHDRMAKLPRGTPGGGRNTVHLMKHDSSKMMRLLGDKLKFKTMEEMIKDTVEDYAKRGW